MESSGWKRANLDEERFSQNYASTDTAYADYHLINYPDGGLISSAANLSKYCAELIKGYNGTGSLLSKESYRTLFAHDVADTLFANAEEDVVPELNTILDKGIFMALAPKNTIGHTGADPGVVTFMFFNSKTGIGRILLVNMTIDDPEQGAFTEIFDIWDKLGAYSGNFGEAGSSR